MSGISLQLRRLLSPGTLGSTVTAYLYAGVISVGPLVLSIVGIFWSACLACLPCSAPSNSCSFRCRSLILLPSA